MFYGNSDFAFFFQFQERNKIGFYKLLFRFFSISILFHSSHSHPNSPDSHSYSLHSLPDSPHSYPYSSYTPHSQYFHSIPRIPILISCIPTLIPRFATLIPRFSIIPLIPFSNSPFRLLQIAKTV